MSRKVRGIPKLGMRRKRQVGQGYLTLERVRASYLHLVTCDRCYILFRCFILSGPCTCTCLHTSPNGSGLSFALVQQGTDTSGWNDSLCDCYRGTTYRVDDTPVR